MTKLTTNITGWLGVFGVLSAYILLSLGIIDSHNLVYQLLNGFGATLLIIESVWRKDYPFTFLNVVWAVVAVIAIIHILFSF